METQFSSSPSDSAGRVRNRAVIIVAAVIVFLSLGVYTSLFGFGAPVLFTDWKDFLAFATGLCPGAILGGFWQRRAGARVVTSVAGVLYGAGVILYFWPDWVLRTAVGTFHDDLQHVYIAMGALGIGMGYISSLAMLMKWFPGRPGLMTSLSVLCCCAGPFFMVGIQSLVSFAVPNGQLYSNMLMILLMMAAAQFYAAPPGGSPSVAGVSVHRAVMTGRFWLLWMVVFLSAFGGISIMSMGQPGDFTETIKVWCMFGSFALGAILWPRLAVKIGCNTVYVLLLASQSATAFALPILSGVTMPILAYTVLGACYAGAFSVAPLSIADFFGTQNMGAIYGCILTAWAAGVGATAVIPPVGFGDKTPMVAIVMGVGAAVVRLFSLRRQKPTSSG